MYSLTLSFSLSPIIYAPAQPSISNFYMTCRIWRANGRSRLPRGRPRRLAACSCAALIFCTAGVVQMSLFLVRRSLCPAWPSSGAGPLPSFLLKSMLSVEHPRQSSWTDFVRGIDFQLHLLGLMPTNLSASSTRQSKGQVPKSRDGESLFCKSTRQRGTGFS